MPLNFLENISLAPMTTFKIGGNARFFVRAENEDDIAEAFEWSSRKGLPLFVLGGGSNVLISDEGFDGLVLQIALKSKESKVEKDKLSSHSSLTAGAGEDWDAFVAHCVAHDLAGVECMSGIPGFVGGTPVQNVGAYGQEVAETITSVRCFDRKEKVFVDLQNADCGFSYRTSIFNSSHRDRYIVTSVTFDLKTGGEPKIVYKDLIEHFAGRQPTLKEVREAVLKIRRTKSMVIDPADPNSRSAGSFFKNPIVTKEKLAEMESALGTVPSFAFGDDVKIPAAWLIERAGFPKGFSMGSAGISSNHTLAIVNLGQAKAADILSLKNHIENAVETKFGIRLSPEPVFVGFNGEK